MSDNPYASPATFGQIFSPAPGPAEQFPVASQGRRFLNLIIDNILIQVCSSLAGIMMGVIYVILQTGDGELGGLDESELEFELQLAGYLVGMSVALGYYVATEAVFQRTPAKFLTGTRVVAVGGGRPSMGQIVGRTLARFIPFEALSYLLGGNHPVGWHDSLSGTRVVSTR